MSGRRARVQGGWAAPKNIRSDRDKPKPSTAPVWLGKNVDQPKEHKFVFEEPEEVSSGYENVINTLYSTCIGSW